MAKNNAKLIDASGDKLTGTRIAQILGVPDRTAQEWLSGGARFPVERLVDLQIALDVGDRLFGQWCRECVRVYSAARLARVGDGSAS